MFFCVQRGMKNIDKKLGFLTYVLLYPIHFLFVYILTLWQALKFMSICKKTETIKWPVHQNLRLPLKARFARRFVGQLSICWTRDSRSEILTKPCLSDMLLLNLSLWKEITFCIHCSPVAGLSGWMYIRFGISGSALPATNHRLEKYRSKPGHVTVFWTS